MGRSQERPMLLHLYIRPAQLMKNLSLLPLMLASSYLLLASCNRTAAVQRRVSAGEVSFASGNYQSAELEFRNAIKEDPRNAVALKRLGTIRLRQGSSFEAIRLLGAAKSITPDDKELITHFGYALLASGFVMDARNLAVKHLEHYPNHGPLWLLLADSSLTPTAVEGAMDLLSTATKSADIRLATAILAQRTNHLDQAELELERASDLGMDSSRFYGQLAALAAARNQLAQAEVFFQKALKAEPSRNPELLNYAMFYIRTNRSDEALKLLTDSAAKSPDFLPAWLMIGKIHLGRNEFRNAETAFEKVMAGNHFDVEGAVLIASIWEGRGDSAKAVDMLEKISKVTMSRPMLELGLARAYVSSGKPLPAIAALDRALASHPGMKEAVLLKSRLLLAQGKSADAILLLKQYLSKDPTLADAQLLLVDAYRASGRLNEAIAILAAQTTVAPSDFRPRFLLGLTLRSAGRTDEARAALLQAQALSPDPLLVVTQRVMLEVDAKQYEAARTVVAEQLAFHTDSPQLLYLRGLIGAEEGKKLPEARADLRQAIHEMPGLVAAYPLLLKVHLALGEPEEAINELQAIVKESPENLSSKMLLGALLAKMHHEADAKTQFEQCIDLNPNFGPAYNELALLESTKLERLDRALELATKARSLLPENPAISDTLGWILFKKKEYPQAFELIRSAAEELPSNKEILYHLGMVQSMMGRIDASMESLQKALSDDTPYFGRADAKTRLNFLKSLDTLDLTALEDAHQSNPSDLAIVLPLAIALDRSGRFEDAARLMNEAISLNPMLDSIHLRLASLYLEKLANPQRALELAKHARELKPDDPNVAATLGQAAFATGQHSWAFDLLNEAARKLSHEPRILFNLAWAEYSLGRVNESRQRMEQIVITSTDEKLLAGAKDFLSLTTADGFPQQREGDDVPALMIRARIAIAAGDLKAAEALYRRALFQFSEFTPAMIGLAEILVKTPEGLDESAKLVSRLTSIRPSDPALTRVTMELAFHRKDYSEVSRVLGDVSAKRELDAHEAYLLGIALYHQNLPIDAKLHLKHALAKGIGKAEATEAEAALQNIGETP
jgi:tetratricopeptide (TPR) repeat protein